jgi:hypothetical protein
MQVVVDVLGSGESLKYFSAGGQVVVAINDTAQAHCTPEQRAQVTHICLQDGLGQLQRTRPQAFEPLAEARVWAMHPNVADKMRGVCITAYDFMHQKNHGGINFKAKLYYGPNSSILAASIALHVGLAIYKRVDILRFWGVDIVTHHIMNQNPTLLESHLKPLRAFVAEAKNRDIAVEFPAQSPINTSL